MKKFLFLALFGLSSIVSRTQTVTVTSDTILQFYEINDLKITLKESIRNKDTSIAVYITFDNLCKVPTADLPYGHCCGFIAITSSEKVEEFANAIEAVVKASTTETTAIKIDNGIFGQFKVTRFQGEESKWSYPITIEDKNLSCTAVKKVDALEISKVLKNMATLKF
jgi:hypothetical protein